MLTTDNGRLKITASNTASIEKKVVAEPGMVYELVFDMDAGTFSDLKIEVLESVASGKPVNTSYTTIRNGKHTIYFKAATNEIFLRFSPQTNLTGSRSAYINYITLRRVSSRPAPGSIVYTENMTLTSRTGNTPSTYTASSSITFDSGFESGASDEFQTFVEPTIFVSDGMERDDYRFGFNGMEGDDEVSGAGNSYTAEFWQYDPRLGRRWNIDPVDKPWMSPYHAFSNKPILNIDPNGANDDNYLIKSDGSIDKQETDDKTDNFKYQDANGKITDLGTFDKTSNGLVNINSGGQSYDITNTKAAKRYMMPEAFAAFLGASMNYFNEYGLKIQVNQFSNKKGGHSGHGGKGQFIDYRYSNTKGNVNEPVWTSGDNFDKAKSQFMVDELVKFGYNSTPSNLRGDRYSILTQDGSSTDPALKNTSYYQGHYHHVHLQNYDKSHIRITTSFNLDVSGFDVIHRRSGLDNFQLPPIVVPKSLGK